MWEQDARIERINLAAFEEDVVFASVKGKGAHGEIEVCDGLILFWDGYICLQMKMRDLEAEGKDRGIKWIEKKVYGKAVGQLRKTLEEIKADGMIDYINSRGVRVRPGDICRKCLHAVVIYRFGDAFGPNRHVAFIRDSKRVGKVHFIHEDDWHRILSSLKSPNELKEYLEYRKMITSSKEGHQPNEGCIFAAYAMEDDCLARDEDGWRHLCRQVPDDDHFDFVGFLRELYAHVDSGHKERTAKLICAINEFPGSSYRSIREYLQLSIKAVKEQKYNRPYKVIYEDTHIGLIVAANPHKGRQSSIEFGMCVAGAAKELFELRFCIGVVASHEGGEFFLDWLLVDQSVMSRQQAEEFQSETNVFRKGKRRAIPSRHFYE